MAEPDFVLLYLGSLFEALHDAPERDDPMLDALAGQILDELPKTLLGLIIKACAARWLRRNLWMVEFDSLSPSDQAARIVIDSAMRIAGSELDPQRHHRTETWNGAPSMSLIADTAAFQRKLADLPIATYQAGETVLTAASTTGRLLILKKGAVAVLKEGVEISKVAEPGAVFGELSVLLDQPHTADVVAVKASQFYVANGATLFMQDPVALLHVSAVLARRLDCANEALIELKRQVQDDVPRIVIRRTVEKIERVLAAGGASLH